MSRSTMTIRYADGTVRYGIFNNTVGVAQPPLFDSSEQAWDWWDTYYNGGFTDSEVWDDVRDGTGEKVLADDSWMQWDATATRDHYTGPFNMDDYPGPKWRLPEDQRPEWRRA